MMAVRTVIGVTGIPTPIPSENADRALQATTPAGPCLMLKVQARQETDVSEDTLEDPDHQSTIK